MSDPKQEPEQKQSRFNWLLLIPPLAFAALALAFFAGLNRSAPDELPSAFAGRSAPDIALPPIEGSDLPAPGADALSGDGVKLVNFWASWCAPCRIEHPLLMEMAAAGIPIIGVNYKDQASAARGFLEELGNPYTTVGADTAGRKGIDWGLYGVPETFVIDGDGKVLLRYPGPITPEIYASRFAPLLEGGE